MWRFASNVQRVVTSTSRRLPSQTTALTTCNPLTVCGSDLVADNTIHLNISSSCRQFVSESLNQVNNCHSAFASTTLNNNTKRCKSTAMMPPEEEPAMGESLDESGYLGMTLNAKVYDVAIETELQHAKSLSTVSAIKNIKFVLLTSCCRDGLFYLWKHLIIR